jgi:NADH-quinone oxidoreductase subunit G
MLAGPGEAVLAGWRMLLDSGRGQDGDAELAATARPAVLHLSAATAAGIGARDGDRVAVATVRGALALPLVITEMPDAVVWVPLNSGVSVADRLGVAPGAVVRIGREP